MLACSISGEGRACCMRGGGAPRYSFGAIWGRKVRMQFPRFIFDRVVYILCACRDVLAGGAAVLFAPTPSQQVLIHPLLVVTPTAHAPNPLPGNPPPGTDPGYWAALRTSCQRLADKAASAKGLDARDYSVGAACRSAALAVTQMQEGSAGRREVSPLAIEPESPATPSSQPKLSIPERMPQWWSGTQGEWNALRNQCLAISADLQRRDKMTAQQRAALPPPSYNRDRMFLCANWFASRPGMGSNP